MHQCVQDEAASTEPREPGLQDGPGTHGLFEEQCELPGLLGLMLQTEVLKMTEMISFLTLEANI